VNKLGTPITSLFFLLVCLWGVDIEINNITSINFLRSLETDINKYFESAPSWSNKNEIDTLEAYNVQTLKDNSLRVSELESYPKKAYELGRVKLALSAKEKDPENQIKLICEAQELYHLALKKSPRNVEYNLALADIESLSRLLPTTCKNQSAKTLNVTERLKLIQHLGPYETNSAYKSGLIYRALGRNIDAMKQFRIFEEYTAKPREDMRNFLLSLTHSPEELSEILPRRYPSINNWLISYERSKGTPKDDNLKAFETAIIETIDSVITKVREGNLEEKKLEEVLLTFYQDPITRSSSEIRKKVSKLLFEYYLVNDNAYAKKLMEAISEREKMNIATSKDFSTKSRKSGSIYNWQANNSKKVINIDLRSEGLGILLNSTKSPDFFTLSGSNSTPLPKNLRVEIWESEDNLDFTLTKDNLLVESGLINGKQSLYFYPGETRSPYIKIFFKFNGEYFNPALNGPIESLIEAFYIKGAN
jgi:hypothetical protein